MDESRLLEHYAEMDGVTPARYLEVWRSPTYPRPWRFPADLEAHMRRRFPRGLIDRVFNLLKA